jgi:hypothetical protein
MQVHQLERISNVIDNYTAFAEMSDLGGVDDLISGAEVGKRMFSLCISMSVLEGISFKRNC